MLRAFGGIGFEVGHAETEGSHFFLKAFSVEVNQAAHKNIVLPIV